MPLLSGHYRVIAMDMYGFGQSEKFSPPQRIEDFSAGVIALMDALNIDISHVLGHHTGALVAFDAVAKNIGRFSSLMISSMPFTDANYRKQHVNGEGVDDSKIVEDGSHLIQNWAKRSDYYPLNRPDLLNRFTHDSLNFGVNPVEGHLACARYIIEPHLEKVICPVLILGASDDPFSLPSIEPIGKYLKNVAKLRVRIIDGGMIPLMELKAADVAEHVLDFLGEIV